MTAPEGWVRLADLARAEDLTADEKIGVLAFALTELGIAHAFVLMHGPEGGEAKYAAARGGVRFDADGNVLVHKATAAAGSGL